MQHPLDRILVESFLLTRDESIFRLLYRRHAPALWRLALRLCGGDANRAEAIVQEAWMRAVERLRGFEWKSTLRTWLAGIVVYCHREALRHEIQQRERFQEPDAGLLVAARVEDPALRMDVAAAFSQLPEGYRTVLTLHDLEGYRHDEIAAMLGIAVGTSKSQLHHARQAFREIFK